ncbi:MAG: SufD family Fe-S cluster assembly protein [Conexivisphaerales archaeon]
MAVHGQSLGLSRLDSLSAELAESKRILATRKEFLTAYYDSPFETNKIFLKNYENPIDDPVSFDPVDIKGSMSDIPYSEFTIGCSGRSAYTKALSPSVEFNADSLQGESSVFDEKLDANADKYDLLNAALRNTYQTIMIPANSDKKVIRATVLPATQKALHRKTKITFGEGYNGIFLDRVSDPSSQNYSSGFLTEVYDITVKDGATVNFVSFLTGRTQVAQNYNFIIGNGARLIFSLWGGKNPYLRARCNVSLMGEGGDAKVFWGSYAADRGKHDMLARVEHWGRNTVGLAVQGAVVNSGSRTLLKGMMVIRNPARGSDSHLKQHALLLSHDSFANAIPGLEIETNDLKAKHAASVSQPDEEQLFYLMSRGFSREEAVTAIATGIVEHVVRDIPDDDLRDSLYEEIRSNLLS